MGYKSSDNNYWTVNKQPDGRYKVLFKTRDVKGSAVIHEGGTHEADNAAYAGAKAAEFAYEQGRQDGRKELREQIEVMLKS